MATNPAETAPAEPSTRAKPPKSKRRRVILVIAVVVLLVAGTIFHFVNREPSSLVLTGVVTTDEVRVGAMTQGHLRDLMVGPGDTVKKGEMLARIEPEDAQADFSYYKNTENASAAAVDESVAQLELLEMQTREQIRQADANLAVSRAQAAAGDANLEQARLELERQQGMRERQLNSQQALDQARTAYEAARAAAESGCDKQIDAAQAALALAKANEEQIAARRAALEATRPAARRGRRAEGEGEGAARLHRDHARRSTASSTCAPRSPGEVVSPGQADRHADRSRRSVGARRRRGDATSIAIRLGDKMPVRLPSGAERDGDVFFRGVDADYATQRDVSRTKRDIKTFEIRLRCDNSDREPRGRHDGVRHAADRSRQR